MNEEEWGPWIEHDGSGCPCVGMFVDMEFLDGDIINGIAEGGESWYWGSHDAPSIGFEDGEITEYEPIIRYRIRKPRGMTILEQLLQNLPEEVEA